MGWQDNVIELDEKQQAAIDASLLEIGPFALDWLRSEGVEPVEDGVMTVADIWRDLNPSGLEEIEAFYAREDVSQAMVVKLSNWHNTDPNVRKQNSSVLAHVKTGRVLDFGAGIGTMAIALALAGNEVECIELGPWQRKFAQARAEHCGAEIKFVDKPTGKYDSIVAMDVIEHLPRPAFFCDLAHKHLPDDGVLACNWVFLSDQYNPQHIHECTTPAREFHKRLRQLFFPALKSAAVTSNGWPSVHLRRPLSDVVGKLSDEWDRYWAIPDPDRRDRKMPLYARILDLISSMQHRKPTLRVVDVGCGRGLLLDRLKCLSGVNAVGVDSSKAAVEICNGNGRFLAVMQGNAENFEVSGPGGFDVILSTDLLGYVGDPDVALEHWRKNVAADGCVMLAVPKGEAKNPSGSPQIVHEWTEERLEVALKMAGLQPDGTELIMVGGQEFILATAKVS